MNEVGGEEVILFIDGCHAGRRGGAEGAIGASNVLSPPVARRDPVHGATTFDEFANHREDAASPGFQRSRRGHSRR